MNGTQTLGVLGEELAGHFLQARGYSLIARNFTCALGEIDLVARDGDVLVFVEVKTRRSLEKGDPADSVTRRKRWQIVKSAQFYLKRYGADDSPCRFDVVSVFMPSGGEPQIDLIPDAFGEGC